jgi:hypothetical protein
MDLHVPRFRAVSSDGLQDRFGRSGRECHPRLREKYRLWCQAQGARFEWKQRRSTQCQPRTRSHAPARFSGCPTTGGGTASKRALGSAGGTRMSRAYSRRGPSAGVTPLTSRGCFGAGPRVKPVRLWRANEGRRLAWPRVLSPERPRGRGGNVARVRFPPPPLLAQRGLDSSAS